MYISWLDTKVPMPNIQMVGVQRNFIKKSQTIVSTFNITSEQLMVWDDNQHGFVFEPGKDDWSMTHLLIFKMADFSVRLQNI